MVGVFFVKWCLEKFNDCLFFIKKLENYNGCYFMRYIVFF